MAENYTGIWEWDPTVPEGTEKLSQADEHIKGTKAAISEHTFPGIGGVVNATHEDLNAMLGYAGDPVVDRFTSIETIIGTVSAEEMATLLGSDISTTIQAQLDANNFKLEFVVQNNVNGLIDYRYDVNGTIDSVLTDMQNQIDAIVGGDFGAIFDAIDALESWQLERQDALTGATLNQLHAIHTYAGTVLPAGEGYVQDDLGQNILYMAEKIENIEDQLGTDVEASVSWFSVVADLNSGSGGINVDIAKSANKWGFVLRGAAPNSRVQFQFWANGGLGLEAEQVNSNKVQKANAVGECIFYVSTPNVSGNWGYNNSELINGTVGYVQVLYTPKDGGTMYTFTQNTTYFDSSA